MMRSILSGTLITILAMSARTRNTHAAASDAGTSRLSDEAVPLRIDSVPARPSPILEIGNGLLETGPIHEGFTLPTLATWPQRVYTFGVCRSRTGSILAIDRRVGANRRRYHACAVSRRQHVLCNRRTRPGEGQVSVCVSTGG